MVNALVKIFVMLLVTYTSMLFILFLVKKDLDTEPEPEMNTKWGLLIAGSKGYDNYRHQADVCHAYQLLRKNGILEKNIVVFMYDDIAMHPKNPMPGIILNKIDGDNVYVDVPKDYIRNEVNSQNVYAVLLGKKNAVKGGSGKVIDSKPDDRIFFFFSGHGANKVLGMPKEPHIHSDTFIEVLKMKRASNGYKEMLMYIEACHSGSVFVDHNKLLKNLDIFVTTAADVGTNSYSIACPKKIVPKPYEYPCYGDMYSVSWIEDSESNNLEKHRVLDQFINVKLRVVLSTVQEYGNLEIKKRKLSLFLGYDPDTKYFGLYEVMTETLYLSLEDQASKISVEEQMQLTTIQTMENDLTSAKCDLRQLKEDTEKMMRAKGEICSQILEKQKKIASLECDASTLLQESIPYIYIYIYIFLLVIYSQLFDNQTLELVQHEIVSLGAKLIEKRTYYTKVIEDINLKFQDQQDWVNANRISREPGEHELVKLETKKQASETEGSSHTFQGSGSKEKLSGKLESAKAKLSQVLKMKQAVVLENSKIGQSIEEAKNRLNDFKGLNFSQN